MNMISKFVISLVDTKRLSAESYMGWWFHAYDNKTIRI